MKDEHFYIQPVINLKYIYLKKKLGFFTKYFYQVFSDII